MMRHWADVFEAQCEMRPGASQEKGSPIMSDDTSDVGLTMTVRRAIPVLRRCIPVSIATLGLVIVIGTAVSADLLASAAPAVAQQDETVPVGPVGFTATTLLQTSTTIEDQPIRFPQGDNQFTAVLGEIAPGGQAGRHMHTVPLLVYMLEGSLSIEMEGYGTHVVSAGEAFTEVVNTWHNGRHLGSTPARFLIVFAGHPGARMCAAPLLKLLGSLHLGKLRGECSHTLGIQLWPTATRPKLMEASTGQAIVEGCDRGMRWINGPGAAWAVGPIRCC